MTSLVDQVRSIAEADAERVTRAYVATLTPDDQTAANSANAVATGSGADTTTTVPWTMAELRFAPARLGTARKAKVHQFDHPLGEAYSP